jgi:4-hydroxythreonine-4-phosphate dehydrogenase
MRTLLITPGDPQGIGPEVTAKALLHLAQQGTLPATKLHVLGAWQMVEMWLAQGLATSTLSAQQWEAWRKAHVQTTPLPYNTLGECGWQALTLAVKHLYQLQQAGQQVVLVTGPVSKANWQQAGIPYTGHTEALEALANQYWPRPKGRTLWQADMAFVYKQFRLLLLTRHCALASVPGLLANTPTLLQACGTFAQWLKSHAKAGQVLSVATLGLNPHAGELAKAGERVGHEEAELLAPVLAACRREYPELTWWPPTPADGFFRGFCADKPKADGVIACTHDQGLIPMKLLGGHEALNITLGLPFMRVSVSHGTADDIAGQGVANAASMIAAIIYAQTCTLP